MLLHNEVVTTSNFVRKEVEEAEEMHSSIALHQADVICGRDKYAYNHAGNKRFREFVAESIKAYCGNHRRTTQLCVRGPPTAATVTSVVADGGARPSSGSRLLELRTLQVSSAIRSVRSYGGRFVKRDDSGNNADRWIELSEEQARDKVGRAIRDLYTFQMTQKIRSRRKGGAFRLARCSYAREKENKPCSTQKLPRGDPRFITRSEIGKVEEGSDSMPLSLSEKAETPPECPATGEISESVPER